ncbi:MAG: hypothetical protein EA000_11080 [Oscillatoriales cyanobacterium]|nr:MAG: hypothetical protein EA000_11080 [Oscillatoriales cyanobacterium]
MGGGDKILLFRPPSPIPPWGGQGGVGGLGGVKKHIKYMCFFILIVELAIAIWCLATQSQKRMERACYQVYTNHGIFKDFVKLLLLYYQCAPNPA